jgi:ERCC4-related helicase
MNCPDCKADGLAALYQSGDDRECGLFITTAVLEAGVDVPDIDGVVMYPTLSSSSSMIQQAGRPARGSNMRGEAIVYITKNDVVEALEYAALDPPDPRAASQGQWRN